MLILELFGVGGAVPPYDEHTYLECRQSFEPMRKSLLLIRSETGVYMGCLSRDQIRDGCLHWLPL